MGFLNIVEIFSFRKTKKEKKRNCVDLCITSLRGIYSGLNLGIIILVLFRRLSKS